MPLSRPYGVTRPVVGQMFHVKHWLWCRWCFGRRRDRPPARLGNLASLGAAPRSPPVPSGPSGTRHTGGTWCAGVWPSQALPPPTAPPPVIQNAQLATESPVICGYVERYTFSTRIGVTPTGAAAWFSGPPQCGLACRAGILGRSAVCCYKRRQSEVFFLWISDPLLQTSSIRRLFR